MKQITNEELKQIQLDILDYVDNFCRENNIHYFLDWGTLLGCVRHHGYIPWDDDIDIGMLREDYNKFMNLFNEKSAKSNYRFYSAEINNKYPFPFGKVIDNSTIMYEPDRSGFELAVNIDVFVYDDAPYNPKLLSKYFKKRDFLYKLNILQYTPNVKLKSNIKNICRRVVTLFLNLLPKGYFAQRIVRIMHCENGKESNLVAGFSYIDPIFCEKNLLQKTIEGDFEGRRFKIPEQFDKFLKLEFGDYMTFPPIEKQVSHHMYEAFFLNE